MLLSYKRLFYKETCITSLLNLSKENAALYLVIKICCSAGCKLECELCCFFESIDKVTICMPTNFQNKSSLKVFCMRAGVHF